MEFLALIHADEGAWERMSDDERDSRVRAVRASSRSAGARRRRLRRRQRARADVVRDDRPHPRRQAARQRRPLRRGRRRRSAATTSSTARRSTTRSTGPRASRRRRTAPSRCVPSTSTRRPDDAVRTARLQRPVVVGRSSTRRRRPGGAPSRCRAGSRSSRRWARPIRTSRAASSSRPREAKVVRIVDGERVVTDGPFAETKEQIGGLFVTDAPRPRRGDPHRGARSGCRVRLDGDQAYRGAVTRVARGHVSRGVASCGRDPHPRPRRPRRSPRTRCRTRSRRRSSAGRATARRARPAPGSSRRRGTVRSTGSGVTRRSRARPSCSRASRTFPAEEDADVSSIPDERLALALHVLPPGARGRRAGRPHAARGRRPRDARDRPRVPRPGARRSRSGSSARSAASARRGSRSASRPTTCCPSASRTCSASLYLVFNEGYAATAGDALVRRELCAEAIRLAKLLCVLMPDEPEAFGLLALLLLQDSRRDARIGARRRARAARRPGPRALGSRVRSTRGSACCDRAEALRRPGPYQLQAVIAAGHARGQRIRARSPTCTPRSSSSTRRRSCGSTARSRSRSPATSRAGLAMIDAIEGLDGYSYLHAARADLLRRLGRSDEAAASYREALALTDNAPERRFLERRLRELGDATG